MKGGKKGKTPAVPKKPAPSPPKEESKEAAKAIYKEYALDHGSVGAEGITKLCADMKIDMAADAEILVFMFMADCKEYGTIKEQEFAKVLARMHVSSAKALSGRKQYFSDFLKDPQDSEFKDFFKWLWAFHKQPMSKSIEKDAAVTIVSMVIGKHFPLVKTICKYLTEVRDDVKGITKDQWINIYDFCKTIKPDLSNYDDLSAWPLLLDEFVEWSKK